MGSWTRIANLRVKKNEYHVLSGRTSISYRSTDDLKGRRNSASL
jgi:hypothetical protein